MSSGSKGSDEAADVAEHERGRDAHRDRRRERAEQEPAAAAERPGREHQREHGERQRRRRQHRRERDENQLGVDPAHARATLNGAPAGRRGGRRASSRASGAVAARGAEAIADDPDIDVVSVVIANLLHREMVEGLLAAGKHVLCEKPLSDNLEDARAMADARPQRPRWSRSATPSADARHRATSGS